MIGPNERQEERDRFRHENIHHREEKTETDHMTNGWVGVWLDRWVGGWVSRSVDGCIVVWVEK
jgi:hypothetical protein